MVSAATRKRETGTEIIEAAITKLEGLKAESTNGEWEHFQHVDGYSQVNTADQLRGPVALIGRSHHDGDLIVVMHRTINAQLAMLRFGLRRQQALEWTGRRAGDEPSEAASLELSLAAAILGE